LPGKSIIEFFVFTDKLWNFGFDFLLDSSEILFKSFPEKFDLLLLFERKEDKFDAEMLRELAIKDQES
jgi:hypothetical protein